MQLLKLEVSKLFYSGVLHSGLNDNGTHSSGSIFFNRYYSILGGTIYNDKAGFVGVPSVQSYEHYVQKAPHLF